MTMDNNKRLALSVFWIALGATLFVLSVTEVLDDGVVGGVGGSLIAVGALQVARNLRARRDPAYRERVETEENDERNRFISMKSWSWTGPIVVATQVIASLVALLLGNQTVQMALSLSVCLALVTYWVTYLILIRRY